MDQPGWGLNVLLKFAAIVNTAKQLEEPIFWADSVEKYVALIYLSLPFHKKALMDHLQLT